MNRIRLYGGPYHGKIITLPDDRRYVQFVDDFVEPMYPTQVYYNSYRLSKGFTTYEVKRYGESLPNPRRARQICVGEYASNGDHYSTECHSHQIMRALEYTRWTVYPASIIDDFDQWFAHHWFALTGKLVWRDEDVPTTRF